MRRGSRTDRGREYERQNTGLSSDHCGDGYCERMAAAALGTSGAGGEKPVWGAEGRRGDVKMYEGAVLVILMVTRAISWWMLARGI